MAKVRVEINASSPSCGVIINAKGGKSPPFFSKQCGMFYAFTAVEGGQLTEEESLDVANAIRQSPLPIVETKDDRVTLGDEGTRIMRSFVAELVAAGLDLND